MVLDNVRGGRVDSSSKEEAERLITLFVFFHRGRNPSNVDGIERGSNQSSTPRKPSIPNEALQDGGAPLPRYMRGSVCSFGLGLRSGNVCKLCVKSIISHSAKLPEQQPISFGRSVIELNAWKCLHFVR